MTLLRYAGRLLLGLIALALVLALALVVLNIRDEAPSARALAWLAQRDPGAIPDAANGAALLWAFDAPAGVDATVLGRTVLAALAAVSPERVAKNDWAIRPPYAPQAIDFPAALACLDANSACIATALDHPDVLGQWVRAHPELFERLSGIDRAPRWGALPELAAANAPLPPLKPLISVFSLSLDEAAVLIHGHDLDAGIRILEEDVRIARRLLATGESVVMKSIASDLLRRALLAYSEILRLERSEPATVARLGASLERVGGALTPEERDMTAVLGFQARRAQDLAEQVAQPPADLAGSLMERVATRAAPLFLKPVATVNLEAELFDIESELAEAPPERFAAREQAVAAAFARRADAFAHLNWQTAYNPLGKIMASYVPDLVDYMARINDDEALLCAVRAEASLMGRRVAFAAAQASLEAMPEALWDPYTHRPLRWSAPDAAIVVTQHSSRGVTTIKVPLT